MQGMQGPDGGRQHLDRCITEPRPYPRCAPPGEIKDDEVNENDRFVASFLNGRSVRSLVTFPDEILESNEKQYALFKVWKDENQLYFPPGKEDARRFNGFKEQLVSVHNINSSSGHRIIGLNEFAAFLPSSDPCSGCHVTEEEGERLKPFRPRLILADDKDQRLGYGSFGNKYVVKLD